MAAVYLQEWPHQLCMAMATGAQFPEANEKLRAQIEEQAVQAPLLVTYIKLSNRPQPLAMEKRSNHRWSQIAKADVPKA